MVEVNKELLLDSAERVAVTAALAGVGVALVEIADWPFVWVPILAAVLNVVKVLLASRVGDPNTGGFVDERTPEQVWVAGEAPEAVEGWDESDDAPIEYAD